MFVIEAAAGEVPSGKKEPQITISGHVEKAVIELPKQATLDFVSNYQRPSLTLLSNPPAKNRIITEKELKANASLIISKLKDFGVEGEILEIRPGPVITMYEFTPAPGTIEVRLERMTRARIDHAYKIYRDGFVLCEALTTLACVNREGRPIPIPSEISHCED